MKKSLIALTTVTVLLAGCDGLPFERYEPDVAKKLTLKEKAILNTYTEEHGISGLGMLIAAIEDRTEIPQVPLCNVARYVESMPNIGNHDPKSSHDLRVTLRRIYGNKWEKCVEEEGFEKKQEVEATTPTQAVTNSPTDPVSTETLEKLVDAAKECNVAKVLIISSKSYRSITETEARALVDDCKWAKLQEELNR